MEPAGIVFLVGIQTQRTHAESVIALERTFEFITDGGVARSLKIDKEDGPAKCSRKEKRAFAHDVCHGAGAARGREREESLPSGLRAASHAGRGCVAPALTTIALVGSNGPRAPSAWTTVTCDHGSSAIASTIRERLVDFDGDDAAMWANKLGEDG